MNEITIYLGKGVRITAPIKQKMTYEEWVRMSNYINSVLNETFLNNQR